VLDPPELEREVLETARAIAERGQRRASVPAA
jgi:hypothetical protein